MKIDNSSKPITPGAGPARAQTATKTGGAQGSSAGASTGSTEATLSGLQGLSSAMATSPTVDMARVAEIKQAIAEGRFQVNAERIADGLLQSVQDMLSASR